MLRSDGLAAFRNISLGSKRDIVLVKNRSAKALLVVLTDGELAWGNLLRDFDWEQTSALPATLRGCFNEEPLYLELRWAKTTEDLSLQNPRFRDAVADLAATIRGLPREELVGEDVRQHRKTRRLAWSAVSILATLLIVASASAVIALRQRQEASRQRSRAEAQRKIALQSAQEASRQQTPQSGFVQVG